MSEPAVEFRNVSKSYPIYAAPGDRLKELATFQRRSFHQDYWALRDVTFDVKRGETFCFVGENGCGKSTLLQICAGILQPTTGTVNVRGRVAALPFRQGDRVRGGEVLLRMDDALQRARLEVAEREIVAAEAGRAGAISRTATSARRTKCGKRVGRIAWGLGVTVGD